MKLISFEQTPLDSLVVKEFAYLKQNMLRMILIAYEPTQLGALVAIMGCPQKLRWLFL